MDEAGSVTGIVEVKVIMREGKQRTEAWRTRALGLGSGSGASKEIESGGAESWKPRAEKGFQKEVQCGFSRVRWQREVNEVKAEDRPMELSVGKSLTLGLAPTGILLGPWESPDSGRQLR